VNTKTDITVQTCNTRLINASPMYAAMTGNSDQYHDLCESMEMWDELDQYTA
jgi:hypothetical protein